MRDSRLTERHCWRFNYFGLWRRVGGCPVADDFGGSYCLHDQVIELLLNCGHKGNTIQRNVEHCTPNGTASRPRILQRWEQLKDKNWTIVTMKNVKMIIVKREVMIMMMMMMIVIMMMERKLWRIWEWERSIHWNARTARLRLHVLQCRVLKCCNYSDGSSEESRTDMRRQVVTQGCINLLRRGYKTLWHAEVVSRIPTRRIDPQKGLGHREWRAVACAAVWWRSHRRCGAFLCSLATLLHFPNGILTLFTYLLTFFTNLPTYVLTKLITLLT